MDTEFGKLIGSVSIQKTWLRLNQRTSKIEYHTFPGSWQKLYANNIFIQMRPYKLKAVNKNG